MTNTKYFYIRQSNKKNPHHRGDPIACIAYQRRHDTDMGEGWDLVTYSFSACSNKRDENGHRDEFYKRDGRIMAHDRLVGKSPENGLIDKGYCFNVERETNSTEVVHFILDEIQSFNWAPSRVRRAARNWLAGKV